MTQAVSPQDAPLRASPLELFFDLVFAFTLTPLPPRPGRGLVAAALRPIARAARDRPGPGDGGG